MQKNNNHKLKSQIFYEENFNINLVNSENVEYAFSQAIFYLEYLILDEEYSYLKPDIKKILNYVKKEIIKADMLIIKGLLLKYMLIGLEKFI